MTRDQVGAEALAAALLEVPAVEIGHRPARRESRRANPAFGPDLVDRFNAGDSLADIADDIGVPADEVEDVIRGATRAAA